MNQLINQIDLLLARQERVTVVIDGFCTSGKTTLAGRLAEKYDCCVIHMDDFFLRPEQRTRERLEEPGGNVDRERFGQEVLFPLRRGETVSYRKFDCQTQTVLDPLSVKGTPLTVVEGAYSMHPDLRGQYDLSVFLDVAPEVQLCRIEKRNSPGMVRRFLEEWIPLEGRYFQALDVKKQCDLVLTWE